MQRATTALAGRRARQKKVRREVRKEEHDKERERDRGKENQRRRRRTREADPQWRGVAAVRQFAPVGLSRPRQAP